MAADNSPLPVRLLRVYREKGLAGVWFGALARGGYWRLVILERRLDEPLIEVAPRVEAEIRRLERDDASAFAALGQGDSRVFHGRLERGHQCWGAWCAGRLRHIAWVAFGDAWVEYLGCRLLLSPAVAYVYRAFTDPLHRRLGLAAATQARCLHTLLEMKRSLALCAVVPENRWAFAPWLKVGYRRIGVLATLGGGFGRWARLRLDVGGATAEGWSVEPFQGPRSLRSHRTP